MDDLIEPRIACSHIVDSDETSEIHEVFHRVHEEREIVDGVGLGDLEHDLFGREIDPVEEIDEVLSLEARVSDRKRQRVDEQLVVARELRPSARALEGLAAAQMIEFEKKVSLSGNIEKS